MEDLVLTGLASESGHARLTLCGLPSGMGPTSQVLSRLAAAGVSVDMVAQADRADGRRQLQVTVREEALPEAREICGALVAELGAERLEERAGLARLALVGSGMHGRPGRLRPRVRGAAGEGDRGVRAVDFLDLDRVAG